MDGGVVGRGREHRDLRVGERDRREQGNAPHRQAEAWGCRRAMADDSRLCAGRRASPARYAHGRRRSRLPTDGQGPEGGPTASPATRQAQEDSRRQPADCRPVWSSSTLLTRGGDSFAVVSPGEEPGRAGQYEADCGTGQERPRYVPDALAKEASRRAKHAQCSTCTEQGRPAIRLIGRPQPPVTVDRPQRAQAECSTGHPPRHRTTAPSPTLCRGPCTAPPSGAFWAGCALCAQAPTLAGDRGLEAAPFLRCRAEAWAQNREARV